MRIQRVDAVRGGPLTASPRRRLAWSVVHNHRSELMAPGDPVVFWVTGPAKSSLEPGIWGVGHRVRPLDGGSAGTFARLSRNARPDRLPYY